MATSITLNGYDLQSTTVKTRTISHDDGPPLELNTLEIAREDGAKLVSSSYGVKEIKLEGIIKGTSQSDLETNIDTFKKNVIGTNLDLDISYAGSTRRYKVSTNVVITRDFYHLTFAPFSITCNVLDPPFGLDTGITEALSVDNLTLTTETLSASFDGTAKPKPKISFSLGNPTNLDEIQFKNLTTNTQMNIGTAWSDLDIVEIDTDQKTVKKNSQNIGFEGVFPEFELGNNDLYLSFVPFGALNQEQTTYNSDADTQSSWIAEAQSFQVSLTGTYNQIELLLKKPTAFTTDEWIEQFTSTTYKDATNTTGDWNTSEGVAKCSLTASQLDQQQTTQNNSDATSSGNSLYQTFIPGSNCFLDKVSLYIYKYGGQTDSATLKIWHKSAFGDWVELASATVSASSIGTSYSWVDFSPRSINGSMATLYSGSTYYIHLIGGDSASAGFAWGGSSDANSYSNGVAKYCLGDNPYDSPTDPPSGTRDFCFKTYNKYFNTSGIIQSLGFDTSKTTNTFLTGTQSVTLNGGTSTLYFSDSADNSTWSDWTTDITTLSRRYIRFKIELTGSATASPVVDYVTITWTGNVEVNVCNDSAGTPGSVISTYYIPYSNIGTGYGWVSITTNLSLSSATTYWIWIKPTSTYGTNRTVYWAYQSSDVYASGQRARKTSSGGSWTTYAHDHSFRIYKEVTTGWEIDTKITYTKRYL